MASIVQGLYKNSLINEAPAFVPANVQYEVLMGSQAYGVASASSDWDVYGFCVPPRDYVFPHLRGEIPGFSPAGPRFDQFQLHHIVDAGANGGRGREYDISIYSIVKYFALCMENNPNMIDSLFVPRRCVLYSTAVGELVRENRHIFLHKGAWHKFKGYAYAQMHKIETKTAKGKRKTLVEQHGYDVKFAYHVVRLIDEVEQILRENDLDLERNREQLKSVRRGEWSLDKVKAYFAEKERDLESLYHSSELRMKPDIPALTKLLLQCLEQHYGSLEACIVQEDKIVQAIKDIGDIVRKLNLY